MALRGFSTKFFSSVFITSPRPCGTTSCCAASARVTVCGNRKLVHTASAAAIKVVSMYSQITIPNRRSSFAVPWASAAATMTNTSTGATPFSALTNRLPSSPIHFTPGATNASTAPITSPARMRMIRLTPLYFFTTL